MALGKALFIMMGSVTRFNHPLTKKVFILFTVPYLLFRYCTMLK
jgi:hypothetical protein